MSTLNIDLFLLPLSQYTLVIIQIDILTNTLCTDIYGTHGITASDVSSAINRLKHNKKDGLSEVVSEHLI